jgi:exosome complex component RRP4
MTEKNNRKIVIPGEVIESGDFLPGENTEKKGEDVIALMYGLAEVSDNLVKVIPLSGTYKARRGNVVIGRVEEITFNGWVIDIGGADRSFLSLMEVPRYVDKNALDEVLEIGDMMVGKVWAVNKRGTDLSIKSRGLGKIDEGLIVEINPNKVPRVIGKEGSMITLIKDETGCSVQVGQNGLIWIKGDNVEDELFAKKAIQFIVDRSFISGLTEEITKWFAEQKKGGKK